MKFLIIQTAFIGDVILATALIEDLHQAFPDSQIDFLLRKGNESLLHQHPHIHTLHIWNKEHKLKNQIAIIKQLRRIQYDHVFNLQRYLSSGIFTMFSGAKNTVGFRKNPLSFLFNQTHQHKIQEGVHETDRNFLLIQKLVKTGKRKTKLYIPEADKQKIQKIAPQKYVVIAPTSVWFTKQWPPEQWIKLIAQISPDTKVFLVGAPSDKQACEHICSYSTTDNIENLAGQLTLLQTAALMQGAAMNYVNDSAPLHLASAMNAPTRAIFCSTVPSFGFTPLSENSSVIENSTHLSCRPCGLHGHKKCPQQHFKCAVDIEIDERFF